MTTETKTATMNPKQEVLVQLGICLMMILLAVGGMAYGVVSGLILAPDAPFTLDGILLVLVCLSILATFGGLLVNLAFAEGWLGKRKASGEEKPADKAGQPAE